MSNLSLVGVALKHPAVFLACLLALSLLQDVSSQFNCNHHVSVNIIINDKEAGKWTNTFCVETVTGNTSEWRCGSLQSALEFVLKLNTSVNSSTCISVLIPTGQHMIDSPVHLGSTSLQLIGLQNGSESPTIYCTYRIDVDLDRLFDLDYVYLDYTLYFNRSRSVGIYNLNMFGCQFPLRLDTIGTVRIANTSFQHFTEAVFDIFNTLVITITNSTFFNNSGTGISRISFRANTGAVAIGFNNIVINRDSDQKIFVSQCNFTGNRATAEAFYRTTDSAFFSQIFTGRGGGLGIYINDSQHNITAMIYDNFFVSNYARSFGGGVYLVIFGDNTQNKLLLKRNVFESNLAMLGAGGVIMSFFSIGMREIPHTTILTDCTFLGNSGESGGAVFAYIQEEANSFFMLERCNFTGNTGVGSIDDYGSAFGIWQLNNLARRNTLANYRIVDCIFENNVGRNGIVSIGYAPVSFYGRNMFMGNRGTSSLRIIGSLVDMYGYVEFSNNEVSTATALELLSFAQINVRNGLQMKFDGNIGRFGASISSSTGRRLSSDFFTKLAFNPLCFIQYENSAVPPSEWTNVSVMFRGNEAVLASSLYASSFRDCSWFSLNYPYFNHLSIRQWPLWDLGNDSRNTGYDDVYATQFHVGSSATIIETPKQIVEAWPGLKFNLPLIGRDEFNNPTAVTVRFNFVGNMNRAALLKPEVVVIDSGGKKLQLKSEFTLKYTLSETDVFHSNEPFGQVNINAPFGSEVTGDTFQLLADLCPGGYELTGSLISAMECQCKYQLVEVVGCEQDQDSVIIQTGYWVSIVPSIDSHSHFMHFYTCPAGYCQCVQNSSLGQHNCVYMFVNTNPDAQCSCNRHGILCGECAGGQGVSVLFDKCISCSNSYGILIPLLVLVQVAIFVLLTVIDKPFITLLYSFTFYIQSVPYTGLYFHETFLTVGQYLHFLSSAMSFYFPYDFCLYNDMTPLVSYFIRLLPLLVAVVTVPLTVMLRTLKWRRQLNHHGVWAILLLSYSHTVHSCMSILNCPRIVIKMGHSSPRWFPSASTVCLTGWHIPLALLSIVILMLALGLIPLSAAIAMEKLPRKLEWTKNLKISLTHGFKEKYKWWAAVELSRRFLFVFVVVLFPKEQVAILLLLCIFMALYGFYQPYKYCVVNVLEIVVEFNFLVILLLVSSKVMEPFYKLHLVKSAQLTSDSCSAVQRNGIAVATWILLPLYYFPILLLAIICSSYLVMVGRRKCNYIVKEQVVHGDDTTLTTSYSSACDVTTNIVSLVNGLEQGEYLYMSSPEKSSELLSQSIETSLFYK